MGISNLNNVHLTDEQITAANAALAQLEQALEVLKVNLTSDDRNRYGRVNEQNKLFINKVNDFALSQPQLRSIDVDWDEFFRDFKSRSVYELMINRLEGLVFRLKNAKTLHDYDNYQDALNDYAYTGFRAGSNAVGFEQKNKELKQFFTKNRKNSEPKDENQSSE
ncbi:hypothetical protein [Capnocytophaga sp.]|uniref:hypothetical protein n=1 Tax=Capnocytophaga sp. TaxID=44737 RepID=UPI0026DC6EC6|nr:hypothetical protein [Capnocytophaga sp.]MDO5104303.1 hypothetical protein [Capnocytophaga sp.]